MSSFSTIGVLDPRLLKETAEVTAFRDSFSVNESLLLKFVNLTTDATLLHFSRNLFLALRFIIFVLSEYFHDFYKGRLPWAVINVCDEKMTSL